MSAPAVAIALPTHLKSPSSPILSKPSPAMSSNRQFGTIKWYNDEQGFGFITSDFGGELMVRSQTVIPVGTLKEGMKVSYEAVQGPILLMADQVQPEE
ncbi:hypothetical protein BDV19DRAFT_359764 [Aspergillus venezuelensis]